MKISTLRVPLLTCAIFGGLLASAWSSSSHYPFRYGFPDPPVSSYNAHYYYNANSWQRPYLDQRTLKRYQDYRWRRPDFVVLEVDVESDERLLQGPVGPPVPGKH